MAKYWRPSHGFNSLYSSKMYVMVILHLSVQISNIVYVYT